MRRAPLALGLLVAPLGGCAAQGAVMGGVVVNEPTGLQSNQLSAATAVDGHFGHLGWELESEVEGGRGAIFTTGLQAGYAYTAAPRLGAVGVLAHLDYGFPIGGGPAGGYAGVTLGLPVSIESTQGTVDRNRYFKLLSTRMELGPLLRYRAYWSWEPGSDETSVLAARHDLSAGLALRMRLTSDLLPGGN